MDRCAGFGGLFSAVAMVALLLGTAVAQQPFISKIEPYNTNQVLIHFDVQPNTTCTLQYTSSLKPNGLSATWSNLYMAPNLPFFEHYIIVDTRTERQRFYRLAVVQ